MAILRHAVPDGSAHHDLLLAEGPVSDEARQVPTWRCPLDPLELEPGAWMQVERLPPHRGVYLRLQDARELDGGRGTVTPVHAGWHFNKDGLLWMATPRILARAFHLEDGRLRRAAASIT